MPWSATPETCELGTSTGRRTLILLHDVWRNEGFERANDILLTWDWLGGYWDGLERALLSGVDLG